MDSLTYHASQRAISVSDLWLDRIKLADRSDLNTLCLMLIQKREVDGLNGRTWDAGAHLYFEEAAKSLMSKINYGYDHF